MGTMNGVNFLQRRRARFLIKRGQQFADEELVAVANFTWVGSTGVRSPASGAAPNGLADYRIGR